MSKQISMLFLIIGLCLIGWNGYGWWSQASTVTVDKEQARSIDERWDDRSMEEIAFMQLANEADVSADVSTARDQLEAAEKKYVQRPDYKQGEEVGLLTIPKMGKIFPVHWGTDQQTLKKGAGLYDSDFTVLPDEQGHTAIAGHRDTVFTGLDQLTAGDRLYLEVAGIKYEYQIRNIWITEAEDRTVIVKKNKPTLTLTTCYPFDFIGSAPDRYIVQAELINAEKF